MACYSCLHLWRKPSSSRLVLIVLPTGALLATVEPLGQLELALLPWFSRLVLVEQPRGALLATLELLVHPRFPLLPSPSRLLLVPLAEASLAALEVGALLQALELLEQLGLPPL